jgi:hypothetical protein
MIDEQGRNLVFLLSLPRSGSTVLSLLLAGHSKIHCPPEPWFLLKLWSLSSDGSTSNRFDDKLATKATNEFLTPTCLRECSRSFAITAYNRELKEHGKEIFVDKTPRYYHILEYIDELLPHAKKIWLQRSPLDVAASYKMRWNVDIDTLTGKHLSFASLDFSLGLFKLAEYFKRHSSSKMCVQYEELVQTPGKVLESICKFIGVPFEPKMLQFAANKSIVDGYRKSSFGDKDAPNSTALTPRAIGQWSAVLSRDELQDLVNLLGLDVLREYCSGEEVAKLLGMGVQPPSESVSEARRKAVRDSHIDLVEELTRVADVRLRQLHEKEEEVRGLKKSVDERLAAIEDAAISLKGKEKEIERLTASLNERLAAIEAASRSLTEKEQEIAATQKVAEERGLSLIEKEREIDSTQRVAGERARGLIDKESEIASTHRITEERRLSLIEKEKMISAIRDVADARAAEMKEKEVAIEQISLAAEERAKTLREKEAMIENLYGVAEERLRLIHLINEELETIKRHWIYRLAVKMKHLFERS